MQIVDLTQPLGSETPMWPGSRAPAFDQGAGRDEDGSLARNVWLCEHSGTHLDAPAHFVAEGATVDEIPAERLICPLAVVDVRNRAREDRDYCLSVSDLEQDEVTHGAIPRGSAVALLTGWSERRNDPIAYLGEDEDGSLHFPGFGGPSAALLVGRRQVRGLGTDTAGIDRGIDTAFTVHAEVTLPRGVWHLEGLINLELLPARGATVFVGAIPFVGGTGAPARVIAVLPGPAPGRPAPAHELVEREEVVSINPVYRITTFVPPESLDGLLESIQAQAPLRFGPYERSAWWSATGVEQFRPLPGSTPTVGTAGQTERVPTVRLEFAIPRDPDLLDRVLNRGLLSNHPWQEPAVFVDECLASATELGAP